jgi:hypothetical protein
MLASLRPLSYGLTRAHHAKNPSHPTHRSTRLHLQRACTPKSLLTSSSTAVRSLHSSVFALCGPSPHPSEVKPRFSFNEWRKATIKRLKEKKAQVLVEYGSTFIFLHEALGIASYGMAFAMAHFGLVNIDDIVNMISIIPDNIKELITSQKDGIATTAVTALILLKSMDVLGLTPLRWFIAITLTPRIAWWVGPKVDYCVDAVKSRLPQSMVKKKAQVIAPAEAIPQPAESSQESKIL